MIVRDVMSSGVVTVGPDTRLKELAELLVEHRISGLPVVDDGGAVVGVISEADLLLKQAGRGEGRSSPLSWIFREPVDAEAMRRRGASTVAEAMSAPAVTVGADRPLREAAELMVERRVNRLPVTQGGRLVGILTRSDVVRAYLGRDERALHAIREDVLRGTMWLDPDSLEVEVREGIARLAGTVDRRSTANIVTRLASGVDGVDRVESELRWQLDDRDLEPAGETEREPTAASLVARDRPRPGHR